MTDARQHLPPVLAEIAEVIGLPLALKLAAECGGTYVSISPKPKPDNAAVKVIGIEAMQALGAHYGAILLEMPIATARHRARRNELIRSAAREGLSQSKLARQHQMTARHVRRICNPSDDGSDGPQGQLF